MKEEIAQLLWIIDTKICTPVLLGGEIQVDKIREIFGGEEWKKLQRYITDLEELEEVLESKNTDLEDCQEKLDDLKWELDNIVDKIEDEVDELSTNHEDVNTERLYELIQGLKKLT